MPFPTCPVCHEEKREWKLRSNSYWETKFTDCGGYISFSTTNHELSYKITRVTKTNQATIDGGVVRDKGHLDLLLGVKTISEVLGLE